MEWRGGFYLRRVHRRLFRSRRCILISLFLILILNPVELAASEHQGHYVVTTYLQRDGLPQGQVLSVYQDSRGLIWTGTYGGAGVYDGGGFRTFSASDGLSGNVVHAFAELPDGRLLIGTDQGLSVFDGHELGRLPALEGWSLEVVRDILVLGPAEILLATNRGLVAIRGTEVRSYYDLPSVVGGRLRELGQDGQGRLVAAGERGIGIYDAGDFLDPFWESSRFPVYTFLFDPTDGLWVGTDQGLHRFEPLATSDAGRAVPEAGSSRIWNSYSDSEGGLWFASWDGLILFSEGEIRRFSDAEGLPSGQLYDVIVDREKNIWLGGDKGLVKLVPTPFHTYTTADGLSHDFIRDICEDSRGRLWLATRDGVSLMEVDGTFRPFRANEALPNPWVFSVECLPDDLIFVGTMGGLFLWDGGLSRTYLESEESGGTAVSSIKSEPGSGVVWIGTEQGLKKWERGRVEGVETAPLDRAHIVEIEADSEGRVWLSTVENGLYVKEDQGWRRHSISEELEGFFAWSIEAGREGGVWLGTNGAGAFFVEGTRIERWSTEGGLADDLIWQVLVDGEDVWFYTNQGLDRWDGAEFEHFDLGDGLPELEGTADAAFKSSSGHRWFGTGFGLAGLAPGSQRVLPVPTVEIHSLIPGYEHLWIDRLRLPPAVEQLAFEFSGLSFRNVEQNRFRYRLLGVDTRWSEYARHRQVNFAGLSPGDYTLQVQLMTSSKVESPVSSLDFVLEAFFWETTWFRLLLVPLGLVVLLGFVRWRSHRLEKERIYLESVVKDRTQQIAENERRFRRALENSPTAVARQDRQLRYNWFQGTILGLDEDQVIGRTEEEVWDDAETASRIQRLKLQAMQSNASVREEVVVHLDEEERIFDCSVDVLRHENKGEIQGVTTTMTDITARRKLEAQLRRSQKMEAVGQLAGGIAHDFNNLLTGILGYTDMAIENLPEGQIREDLLHVKKLGGKSTQLVRQLLAFARQQPMDRGNVDIDKLLTEMEGILSRMVGEKVRFSVEVEPDLWKMYGDRGQLEQVILNLSINASEAMPDGGEIKIHARNVSADEEEEAARFGVSPGAYVFLSFEDTGTGIEGADRERVFEPFFSTKDRATTSGLGLTVVYGVVQNHGGGIVVKSEPGVGTKFEILLPATSGKPLGEKTVEKTGPTVGEKGELRGNGERVLVVDDEGSVLSLVRRILEARGFLVLGASTAEEAESVYSQAEEIDLLLTDVVMPGVSGVELYRRLRVENPSLNVLFMSGYSEEFRDESRPVIEASFLAKPFSSDDLLKAVQLALKQGS